MDVTLPNGQVLNNVPDGTTKAQIVEKLKAGGHDVSWYSEASAPSRPQSVDEAIALIGPEGQMDAPSPRPEPQPEQSLADTAVGALEAGAAMATGATTGALGYAGGAIKGIAEEVASGEFGSYDAADRAKKSAEAGAAALTYAPRGESGQEIVKTVAGAIEPLAALTPLTAEISAILAMPKGARIKTITPEQIDSAAPSIAKSMAEKFQTPSKKKIAALIQEDPRNTEVVKYIVKGSGRVGKDKNAMEAIRQGFDESVIAAVKGSKTQDVENMLQMMKVLRAGKKNAVYAAENRPTDIVGDSLASRIKHTVGVKNKAGQDIKAVSRTLRGKDVDYSGAMDGFLGELADNGVNLEYKNGRVIPKFKGSAFQGNQASERLIKRIVNRLSDAAGNDALDVHLAKQFISEEVSFGAKSKSGLPANAEIIVKNLRRGLNESLNDRFPAYRDANSRYSTAKGALDNVQKAVGTSVDLTRANVDKSLGTSLRRILSNAQSRVGLLDSIKELESIVKSTGGKVSDDIISQVIFADELDRMFGAPAKTSLKGQTEQALRRGADVARGRGLTEIGIDVAGTLVDKARGVTDEKAIAAIEKLLRDKAGRSK